MFDLRCNVQVFSFPGCSQTPEVHIGLPVTSGTRPGRRMPQVWVSWAYSGAPQAFRVRALFMALDSHHGLAVWDRVAHLLVLRTHP